VLSTVLASIPRLDSQGTIAQATSKSCSPSPISAAVNAASQSPSAPTSNTTHAASQGPTKLPARALTDSMAVTLTGALGL
jgi:hypothetical protein